MKHIDDKLWIGFSLCLSKFSVGWKMLMDELRNGQSVQYFDSTKSLQLKSPCHIDTFYPIFIYDLVSSAHTRHMSFHKVD